MISSTALSRGPEGCERLMFRSPGPGVQARWGANSDQAIQEKVRDLGVLFGDGRALDEVRRLAMIPMPRSKRDGLRSRRLSKTGPAIFARSAKICSGFGSSIARRFEGSVSSMTLRSAVRWPAATAPFIPPSEPPSLRLSPLDLALPTHCSIAWLRVEFPETCFLHSLPDRSGVSATLSLMRNCRGPGARSANPNTARQALVGQLKTRLTPETLSEADNGRGRLLFDRACAGCHRLFGEGAEIGPDLTGAGREDSDYLLQNIIDPSAQVDADYRVAIVALDDGRVLNGVDSFQDGEIADASDPRGGSRFGVAVHRRTSALRCFFDARRPA